MKRLVSLLLVIALVISTFSVTAFAEENELTAMSEVVLEQMYDAYLIENGATVNDLDLLTFDEKRSIFQNTKVIEQIDEDVLDAFLLDIDFTSAVLAKMDYSVKWKIYSTLKELDKETLTFDGYDEVICTMDESGVITPIDIEQSGMNSTMGSGILSECLQFSATAVKMQHNNMNRYYVYPAVEWIAGGTQLSMDSFSFALNSSNWTYLSDDDLTVTGLYSGGLAYEVAPSVASFLGRSYKFDDLNVPEVNYRYEMVGCLIARPTGTTVDKSVIFNYAQDLLSPMSISVEIGVFSISVTGATRQLGEQLNFRMQ